MLDSELETLEKLEIELTDEVLDWLCELLELELELTEELLDTEDIEELVLELEELLLELNELELEL